MSNPCYRFNLRAFQNDYPDLFNQFATIEINGYFLIKTLPSKNNDQLIQFKEICELQRPQTERIQVLKGSTIS
tara:strand:- start:87 stop:305 length:219 start_codon:yes stop_codon:yes gene_type:complete